MNVRRWPPKDRRPPALANQRGHGPTLIVNTMPAWQRGLFAAQYRMWLAACELQRVTYLNTAYGVPMPPEPFEEYRRARANWVPWLRMLAEVAEDRLMAADIRPREDYL